MWEQLDSYIKNSPVFDIPKVTTPVLMMSNRKDESVPWRQGLEFYLGVRRLDRRTWFLQYDNGGHGVSGVEAIDFTYRMTQFFDHYLKSMPPPKWMSETVPPEVNGRELRYELYPERSCGDGCDICREKKYESFTG